MMTRTLSCCSKIFPYGTLANKDFFSSIKNLSLKVPIVTNKESLLLLTPSSDLASLYNQFNNTSLEKRQ